MTRANDEADVAERLVSRATSSAEVVLKAEREPAVPGQAVKNERRAETRYAINLSVTLVGDHNFYVGFSENLSEGGIFVRTQQVLPIGTRLEVTLTLPTCSTAVRAVGIVRWVRLPDAVREEHNNYGSGDPSSKPGMGLQFEALDPATADAITRFAKYREPEFFDT